MSTTTTQRSTTMERRFTPTGCVRCGEIYYGTDECPRCSKMEGWIVIGHDRAGRTFEVHREKGESDLDVVNKAAEIADKRPDLVYTVVREHVYRNGFNDGLRWLRDRNYQATNDRTYRGV